MRFLSAFVVLAVCASGVSAQVMPQRFSGTTPNPVPAEGTLNVKYTNSARAGTTITIEAYDAGNRSQTQEVTVTIDASGEGSGTLDVPLGWTGVVLSYPDSADLSVLVQDAMARGIDRAISEGPAGAARR